MVAAFQVSSVYIYPRRAICCLAPSIHKCCPVCITVMQYAALATDPLKMRREIIHSTGFGLRRHVQRQHLSLPRLSCYLQNNAKAQQHTGRSSREPRCTRAKAENRESPPEAANNRRDTSTAASPPAAPACRCSWQAQLKQRRCRKGPATAKRSQEVRHARMVQTVELLLKIKSVKKQQKDIQCHRQLLQQAIIGQRVMIQELQKQVQEKEAAEKEHASQQQAAARAAATEQE